ncbi:sugar transferase [Bacilliculturomica massiliensis]|uniref:sugar transferase n=1 Tax=Bacilliculturomica massiliensis TaxID=1917867 RepID=UPI0010323F92|nr:sugar transferase [Bacilliculturomica massiliensis]
MRVIKRGFDLICASFLVIILSPLLIVLSIVVRCKLGKPALFKQKRPGLDGRIFTMYKFRSMTDELDEDGNLLPDDLRMTDFGRLLRSSSLDELPELFNIIKGEMSFVGPRPQLIRDMVFFSDEQMQRQSVIPGLTGWAQVNGRNSISWEDKFRYDLEYIDNWSLGFDIKILWMTILKVFKREGIHTEGMETAEDYGVYLLRIGKIDLLTFEEGMDRANKLIEDYNESYC